MQPIRGNFHTSNWYPTYLLFEIDFENVRVVIRLGDFFTIVRAISGASNKSAFIFLTSTLHGRTKLDHESMLISHSPCIQMNLITHGVKL